MKLMAVVYLRQLMAREKSFFIQFKIKLTTREPTIAGLSARL